jgi:ABC-type branched-subunit amino acid transport system ATPase component
VLRLPAARRARRESDALALELLEAAGLSAVADVPSGALDSTARRILDVLVACANGGSFVLLDEPAAGLSKEERRILGALITGLAKAGVGVVLVEHDLDLAIGLADTVTVLERGVPIFSGEPADARTDVRVSEAFLGAAR